MQTCEPATCEFLRRLFVAEESLQIRRGKLDEGLEEVSLFAVVAGCMPKAFKNFVAFPPVGVVVEVDPIQVVL